MTLALTMTLSNSTLYCSVLYTEDCLFCTQRNQPHLLSGLLLLLALVALVAQLVSHLPAGLRLLLQPVGHGFCVILQLPLLLEKKDWRNGWRRALRTYEKGAGGRQDEAGDETSLLSPLLVSQCLLEDRGHTTSARRFPHPAAAAWETEQIILKDSRGTM